jgi:hypothetical protein
VREGEEGEGEGEGRGDVGWAEKRNSRQMIYIHFPFNFILPLFCHLKHEIDPLGA